MPTWKCKCSFTNGRAKAANLNCGRCGAARSERSLKMGASRATLKAFLAAGGTKKQRKNAMSSSWEKSTAGKAYRKKIKYMPATKALNDRYRQRVRAGYKSLILQLSHEETGMCAECKIRTATEIDHMRPELKGICLSQRNTWNKLTKEINRNTVEGTCWLRGVCKMCHDIKTHSSYQGKSRCLPQMERIRFANEYKCLLSKCSYEHCEMPQELCVPGAEMLFHMDHLHHLQRLCNLCAVDPSLRKVECISILCRSGTMETLKAELRPEKVRLMHGGCHREHTNSQCASGVFRPAQLLQKRQIMPSSSLNQPPVGFGSSTF